MNAPGLDDLNGPVEGVPPDRGLDRRPRMRRVAGVVWCAFLGASIGLVGLLLMPESWLDLPVGFERLAISFVFLFVMALITATFQMMLSDPGLASGDRDAR